MPKPTIFDQYNEKAYVPPQPLAKVIPFPERPEQPANVWQGYEEDDDKVWQTGWWAEKPLREKAALLTIAALGLGSVGLTLNSETVGQGMVQRFQQLEQLVGLQENQAKKFKSSAGQNVSLPTLQNRAG